MGCRSQIRTMCASVCLRALCAWAVVSCGGSTAVRRAEPQEREFPAGVVHLRWRTPLNERAVFQASPEECATGALVGKRLVVGSRAGRIVALDTADGRVLWSTAASGGIDGEARLDDQRGHVYLGTDDGFLYAVDPASGVVRWSYRARGAIERRPEIGADSVYISTSSDRVFALDARTGRFRWQYERETPEGFTIHGHSGPRLREGVLYTGFSDGYLVALSAGSGDPLWAKSLAAASDQFVDVDATPSLVGDLVLASSYSGGLYALRARDGEIRWRYAIEGASAITATASQLYVAAPRDGIAALTTDAQVLWRQGLADAGDLTAPLAIGPYLVFAGSRAGLFVVERATGRLLQIFNPGRGMCAAPAVSGNGHELYVLANSGTLYALDLEF